MINCDLGERGMAHPIDDAILAHVQMINLACGGHAGDEASVQYYLDLADQQGVQVSAHLSYPDRTNFGRIQMEISWPHLQESLEDQLTLFGERLPAWTKPHGALYHALHQDSELGLSFLIWAQKMGLTGVIGMSGSAFIQQAEELGLEVLREGFAERRYILKDHQLVLSPRVYSWASIHDLGEATRQGQGLLEGNTIEVAVEYNQDQIFATQPKHLELDTLCIHSDSEIALELARALCP